MKTLMYVCPVCGNVIVKLVDSGVVPTCCGREMQLQYPEMHEEQGVSEKHLPDVSLRDASTLKVCVGTTPHPMTKEHLIRLILLESEHGLQVRFLTENNQPSAKFYCGFDKPEGVYAWCNLHGLWGTHHLPPTVKHASCSTKHCTIH